MNAAEVSAQAPFCFSTALQATAAATAATWASVEFVLDIVMCVNVCARLAAPTVEKMVRKHIWQSRRPRDSAGLMTWSFSGCRSACPVRSLPRWESLSCDHVLPHAHHCNHKQTTTLTRGHGHGCRHTDPDPDMDRGTDRDIGSGADTDT